MSRKKLFKNILFNKNNTNKNDAIYKVEYRLGEQLVALPYKDKIISRERSSILNLVNDFYYETCSIKNIPKIWWILMLIDIVVLGLFFSSVSSIHSINSPTFIQKNTPIIYGLVFVAIFYILREINTRSILKKMQKKYNMTFESIDHARIFWLQKRLGDNIDFFDTAKQLSEWKELREKHSEFFQYDYRKTVYNTNAKPRVIALTIALISICALLIMNTSDVSYNEVISQLATNIFYIIILSPIIIIYFLILAFIITISWRAILMALDGFVDKGIVSNIRFGFLIEFLTTYSDLKKSKYKSF